MKCPYCNKQTTDAAQKCVHCGKGIQIPGRNRFNSIRCPSCNTTTRVINLAGIELDFCHECSGIWFDRRELKQFQKIISDDEKLPAEIALILRRMTSGRIHPDRNAYLKCPICDEPMVHKNFVEFSGVILDRCPTHGTWAEKHDLVRIFDLIASGDIEDLLTKASHKQRQDLEKKMRQLESEQSSLKAGILRNQRFSRTHFVFDMFGFL